MSKITQKSMVSLLFCSCWAVYFSSYLGRLNFSAAMPQLLFDGVLQKSQAGLISTVFFVTYSCGQLLNGFLGDKFRPQNMLVWGMLISAISNISMILTSNFQVMIVAWAVNGYSQSMIWPPIVRIFTDMLHRDAIVKCFTNLSTTIAAGTLFSYFISAMLLKNTSWQWVFGVPAIIILIVAIGFKLVFLKIEKHRKTICQLELEDNLFIAGENETVTPPRQMPFKNILLSLPMFLFLIPVLVHGVLKDGLTAWIPTFISENFNAGPVMAVLVSMILPVVNIFGAYAARFLQKKFSGNAIPSALFFVITAIAMITISFAGKSSLIICLLMLSISSCAMMAVNTIFISYVPIKYASVGRASTVSGFLNAVAYLGASISSVGIGIVVSFMGWNAVMILFFVLVAIAGIVCYTLKKNILE